MNIIFICGSIEPGRDGVGDYTRRLAIHLIKSGNKVGILAIKDHYIKNVSEEVQVSEGVAVNVYRLGSNDSANFNAAEEFISRIDPEWLSLQYVSFAFQKKGLPMKLGKNLQKLGKGRKWHIMFHELWVGMDEESPIRYRLWGKLQEIIIRRMIRDLQPQLIHTQAQIHCFSLKRFGYKVNLLPLFSNIPVTTDKKEVHFEGETTHVHLSFVVFGRIHPGAPINHFAEELVQLSKRLDKTIEVIFIGNSGSELEVWDTSFRFNGIPTRLLGERNAVEISKILSDSSIGISSTPYIQSEKSSVIATFLEHKLPVFIVSKPWNSRYGFRPSSLPNISEYIPGNLSIPAFVKDPIISLGVSKVSKIFHRNINGCFTH